MVKLTKNDVAPGSTVAETLDAHERGESRDHTLNKKATLWLFESPPERFPNPEPLPCHPLDPQPRSWP